MKLPWTKTPAAAALDTETVRQKLAECEAEIASTEEELRQVGMAAVLGENPAAADDVQERLRKLRERRELLTAALDQALAAEQDAQAELRQRDFLARRRAAAQHAGRVEKLARSVSELEGQLVKEFHLLTEAAASLVATLPSRQDVWREILSDEALREMCLLEGHRLGREAGAKLFRRPEGTSAHERRIDGSLPFLSDRIAELTAQVRSHFDRAAPPATEKTSTPAAPQPELNATPGDVPTPLASLGVVGGPTVFRNDVIDLRGQDLGVEKVPNEPEEVTANA